MGGEHKKHDHEFEVHEVGHDEAGEHEIIHRENVPDIEEVVETEEKDDIVEEKEVEEKKSDDVEEKEVKEEKKKKSKDKTLLFVIIAAVFVLIILFAIYLSIGGENENRYEPVQEVVQSEVEEEIDVEEVKYFNFYDVDGLYSVKIPEGWVLAEVEDGFRLNESPEDSNQLINFDLVQYDDELDVYLTEIAEEREYELEEKTRLISAGLQGRRVKFNKGDSSGLIVVLKKNDSIATFYLNSDDEKYVDALKQITGSFVLFEDSEIKEKEKKDLGLLLSYKKDFDVDTTEFGFEIKREGKKVGEIKVVESEETVLDYRDSIIELDNFELIDEYENLINDKLIFTNIGSQFERRKKLYLQKEEGVILEMWLENIKYEKGFERIISTLEINK